VRLKVTVGPNGRVTDVEKPAESDVIRKAIMAAAATTVQSWQFNPATINGIPVRGEYIVTFRFSPSGAQAATR